MLKSELRRVIVKPFDKDKFELVQEYVNVFYLKEITSWAKAEIPAGYKTNGADIPRIFWSIYPPNSPEYLTAVVIHDFLCDKSKTREDYKIADLCLKEALQMLGINKFKIWVFYTACNFYHTIKFLFKRQKDA